MGLEQLASANEIHSKSHAASTRKEHGGTTHNSAGDRRFPWQSRHAEHVQVPKFDAALPPL